MEVQGLRPNGSSVLQLDTVRALHQTVVSLRAALEASKSELNELRQKYSDSSVYADTVEKLAAENRSLKQRLAAEEVQQRPPNRPPPLPEKHVTFVDLENNDDKTAQLNPEADGSQSDRSASVKSEQDSAESVITVRENAIEGENVDDDVLKIAKGEFETKIELESKYDVTIKVLAHKSSKPINIETVDTHGGREPIEVILDSSEEIVMAGSKELTNLINKNNDRFNVQVKITSQENLIVDPSAEREGSASEQLNPEADEVSARDISEGENSVFSEIEGTITETGGGGRRVCEQDSISGNDSEEVDDIELIFTTEETKEFTSYQEDLVSITDGENWTHGESSTPVLLKFNTIDPEVTDVTNNKNTENKIIIKANEKLTQDKNQNVDTESESQDTVEENEAKFRKGFSRSTSSKSYFESQPEKRCFESTDSLTYDNQKSYSFDHTKSSSLDRGSSMDIMTRDLSFDHKEESIDQFDVFKCTKRTQYSVCIETDISKCGVMEDDLARGNLNIRRNTCPNPFQYRPLAHRDVVKGFPVRPLLGSNLHKGPRRSSAAQTDISALPNHWRSDTHIAKKIPSTLTTLPSKVTVKGSTLSRPIAPSPFRPTRMSEENRRILLSDIGFTSMVPELSRSAEPIWGSIGAATLTPSTSFTHLPICCAQHAAPYYGSVPSSPTRQDSSNTNSKYWSKSSIQRSTSGRMGEMTPGSQRISLIDQPTRGGWRGSMPELRKKIPCCSRVGHHFHKMGQLSGIAKLRTVDGNESGDSTDELLDEADFFLRSSIDCMQSSKGLQDDFYPSRYSRPYLPSVPRQLRLGHLVKIIAPHGRIALGKVRYVGIAGGPTTNGTSASTYVGVQLKTGTSIGGDGSFHGRRYFHCDPGCSLFVPFSKVVVAWANI